MFLLSTDHALRDERFCSSCSVLFTSALGHSVLFCTAWQMFSSRQPLYCPNHPDEVTWKCVLCHWWLLIWISLAQRAFINQMPCEAPVLRRRRFLYKNWHIYTLLFYLIDANKLNVWFLIARECTGKHSSVKAAWRLMLWWLVFIFYWYFWNISCFNLSLKLNTDWTMFEHWLNVDRCIMLQRPENFNTSQSIAQERGWKLQHPRGCQGSITAGQSWRG